MCQNECLWSKGLSPANTSQKKTKPVPWSVSHCNHPGFETFA